MEGNGNQSWCATINHKYAGIRTLGYNLRYRCRGGNLYCHQCVYRYVKLFSMTFSRIWLRINFNETHGELSVVTTNTVFVYSYEAYSVGDKCQSRNLTFSNIIMQYQMLAVFFIYWFFKLSFRKLPKQNYRLKETTTSGWRAVLCSMIWQFSVCICTIYGIFPTPSSMVENLNLRKSSRSGFFEVTNSQIGVVKFPIPRAVIPKNH